MNARKKNETSQAALMCAIEAGEVEATAVWKPAAGDPRLVMPCASRLDAETFGIPGSEEWGDTPPAPYQIKKPA